MTIANAEAPIHLAPLKHSSYLSSVFVKGVYRAGFSSSTMMIPKPLMCGIPYHSRNERASDHSLFVLPLAIGALSFLRSYAPHESNYDVGLLRSLVVPSASIFHILLTQDEHTLRYPFYVLIPPYLDKSVIKFLLMPV